LLTLARAYGLEQIDPVSLALLQAKRPNGQYAIPSAGASAANLTTIIPTPLGGISRFQEDQFNANVDLQIGANNRLTGSSFTHASRNIRPCSP